MSADGKDNSEYGGQEHASPNNEKSPRDKNRKDEEESQVGRIENDRKTETPAPSWAVPDNLQSWLKQQTHEIQEDSTSAGEDRS